VHQASGIVSVQCGCNVADALAMIRARAYAKGAPVESIATDIVERGVRLE
jgi:AmiR/NasT family two-component response regulator